MNTDQIDRILSNIAKYQGVYSSDTLPDRPHLLVCNIDPSTKVGSHWVAIYVDEKTGRGEYFDSFGRPPQGVFKTYMNKHCIVWTFNNRQLQSVISSFCGFYCCVYCLCRSRGLDLKRIVSMFSNDTGYNDYLVHRFICQ